MDFRYHTLTRRDKSVVTLKFNSVEIIRTQINNKEISGIVLEYSS